MENKKINGHLYFDKKILNNIVAAAVTETIGVARLYKVTSENFLMEKYGRSIKILYNDLGMLINIKVVVYNDTQINDLIYKIQTNIKNSIHNMIEIPIVAINVMVSDAVENKLN